ncbi:glycosyltransferase [Candidatus Nitrospira bockiana]
MLQTVDVGERSIEAYRGVAPDVTLDDLVRVAEPLRGVRILHLNATPYGGGVSELLRSAIPLLNDLGLVADWKIIQGDERFFVVTKALHNGLQGAHVRLTSEQQAIYLAQSEQNARMLEEEYDVIVVNDPQPAAILPLHGQGNARWLWRCHIDTSRPNPEVWQFLRPYLTDYDAAVFTMAEFVPPDFPVPRVEIIPPAIDPLSPKNLRLADETARQILDWIGIRLSRPLITQVARFDPWKDPLGVIEAYKLARREVAGLQLALVGSMALDDPEGWEVYRRLEAEAQADPLVHVFTNLTGVGNIEVNAFQRLSSVVVQKSIREGFGLVVSEALWKGTPVVAGQAGGIPLQMADGVGGILVDTVEGCAAGIIRLLQQPAEARELGERGRERVRGHFLLPRLLLNELTLIHQLIGTRPAAQVRPPDRDPVCGMALKPEAEAVTAIYRGHPYRFCSDACRARFFENPDRYLSR